MFKFNINVWFNVVVVVAVVVIIVVIVVVVVVEVVISTLFRKYFILDIIFRTLFFRIDFFQVYY